MMIQNSLRATLRILWKNRSHTLINMFGLALGITCSILIFLIIRFELSFDDYHPKKNRIYRVVVEYYGEEEHGHTAGITYPLPVAIRNDFPDPEYVTIVDSNLSDPVISVTQPDGSETRSKEDRVTFVDPEYFRIFHYDWVRGNTDALTKEKTVVITESIAKKYFGTEDPLNRTMNFNNEFDVTVTGIVEDPPKNTDLQFQMIFSSRLGNNKRGWDNWGAMSSSINCFLQLGENSDELEFEAKLKDWHLKYFTGSHEEEGKNRRYLLQPLSEIHYDTNYHNIGAGRVVSNNTLASLGLIGIFLLITACINFVNLNTVLIISRSKEAGIRKVMGSTRSQILMQFISETFCITLIALLLSTGLVELALIYLTPVLGYRLSFYPLTDPTTLAFLICLPIAVTLLAGLYPGVSLSRFQPVRALRNKLGGDGSKGITLRRSLITAQLVISQVLVVCTIIVLQQLNYFMSQPLGLNSHAVVEFGLPENKPELIDRLSERLKNIPGVVEVCMSNTGAASTNQWTGGFEATVGNTLIKESTNVKFADANYIETYQIKLLHGDDLVDSDTANRFVVNEKFARILGFENPSEVIGTPVNIWGNKAMISGVVQDFHTNSLHSELDPAIIMCGTSAYYIGAARLNTQNTMETITAVQQVWEDTYPKYVFEYKFLDDTIAKFYEGERRSSYMIGVFAGVAILIGCIGLFGLVSFIAKNRTKEVGIRKALGATVGQVISLFSKEFVMLVTISFFISSPLAWYFMEEWLENFAYRIHPGVQTFLAGIVVTLVVVLATVGLKSYKAAIANPVDALRDE